MCAYFPRNKKKITIKIFLVNICIIKLHPEKVSIKHIDECYAQKNFKKN